MIAELVAGLTPPPYAQPWWDAVRAHRLTVQACRVCGHRQHHPRPVCIACGSDRLHFEDISRRGIVLTYTTIHRAPLPELRGTVPYSVALVELDHGIRMFGALSMDDPSALRIDAEVEVGFVDVTDEATLLRFSATRN